MTDSEILIFYQDSEIFERISIWFLDQSNGDIYLKKNRS